MKTLTKLIIAFCMTFVALPIMADVETKRVCVDVKDKDGKPVKNKDGSTKQNCKNIKQHKKLDTATPVPK